MYRNQSFKNYRAESQHQRFRLNLLIAILIILSLILILRLAFLQISEFKRYQTLSLKNQMSVIPIAPPRGVILDRNGVLLAENIPVYVLEITPERVKDMKQTLTKLRELLPSITDEDIDNFNKTRLQNRSFVPIPVKLKLSQEEVATFASNQYHFPGVSIKARLMRHYPLGEITAHALGYVGRINIQELKQVNSTNYRATNFIGKAGVEKYYEDILHGKVGYQMVETDVSGRTLRIINKVNPHSGAKLYLSIDARLQEAAYNALKDKRGAVVVINSRNGEILTMVSSPSFDPNIFVSGVSKTDYKVLSNALQRPLFNRAVRGVYPPASTIKPFVGLAGLDKGFITTTTEIYDPGKYKLPTSSHIYRDWKKTGHGVINFKRAITVSCDTFFYQLGNKMGISNIEDMLVKFGLGQLTHVDLHEEANGVIPSARWKRQTKGVSWYPGDTLISAIGQGFMLATPLQIANATASLSQHGQRFRPHLLIKTVNSDTNETEEYKPFEEYPVSLRDEANWDVVIDAMHSVLTSNEGTGYRFGRNPPYPVAGKTGTAQVYSGRQYEKAKYEDIPEHLRDNSLFIAFTPVEKPEIAIAVVVENDTIASTVARKVLDTYYELYPIKKTP
ncbi:penicillin-binding protein 2 [Legionella pneumophila]|uniref:Peptidoglycan D,D-transpeptidase MrdA n=1 Tax=Legionella pneumophila subsp. pascullei TaxID=91890 RepID=A0AAX2IWG7_LEGPN|nr:penicillin-binding protein 2 [Legionella pneumophila]AMP92356.1 penicillin-binding protein [Legionella pneumophila subsp. pascullei]AMP95322.1 penicillin-binding protein [Legionella pneumophila subsp. pascullei]SQG90218.1 penicillin binding protein 2 [Legionella pneumophila subsp. pascullei]VEH06273.1 penicillin binding protein 2 [Legionella pneumophila subsp. pascullei]HDU8259516.1 penicillin-binding protein 2 [Legionella pneumophila]